MVTHFAPIHFYKQATLRTETFTESSFYAQIFLHTEVCAHLFFVHRRLYTQRFSRKEGSIYTQMLCTNAFARINKGTTCAFLHRTFSTEKPLHRTVFTHVSLHEHMFDTEKLVHTDCTQKFLQTAFFCMQKLYAEQFLHSRFFFAQKPLRTKTIIYTQQFLQTDRFYTQKVSESSPHRSLRHIFVYAKHFLHTDVFTHRCLYTHRLHTETCAHSTCLHIQPTLTQRGFVSPS